MEIKVRLHGLLRDSLPREMKGQTTLTLPETATVQDVVAHLNIKRKVSANVNGVLVQLSYRLQPNDALQLFRIVGGG